MTDAALQAFALDIARQAGDELRRRFHGALRIRRKAVVDLVTDADLAAEGIILDRIRTSCPHDEILTEETGGHPGSSSRRWVVDPLDGTTNFAHGHPHFAVSIAVEQGGELRVGVVHDPLRGETFHATRGHGAYLNGKRIRVSRGRDLGRALIATGFPYDRRRRPTRYLKFVARALRACEGLRRAGSAALDLAWLAAGRLDAFWEWKLAPWDVAAGSILVREAGGLVTTVDGAPHGLDASSIAASNGLLHRPFLSMLAWDGRLP